MNAPYAGTEGMLQQMKGKLIIRNEKPSISQCRSRFEADVTDSVCSVLYPKFFGGSCDVSNAQN